MEECLRIAAVAKGGPGDVLGLVEGDLLITVNDTEAASADLVETAFQSQTQVYRFVRPGEEASFQVTSESILLGIEFEKTREAIVTAYNMNLGDNDDLRKLWQYFDFEALALIVARWKHVLAPSPRNRLHEYWLLFLNLLCLLQLRRYRPDEPELMYVGIVEYERGERSVGIEKIRQFLRESAHDYRLSYRAVGYYYEALEQIRAGDREQALEIAHYCQHTWPMAPFEHLIKSLGGDVRPPYRPHLDSLFPVNYRLPREDKIDVEIDLGSALGALEHGQFHLVVVLGGWRSNGPYYELMLLYRTFLEHLDGIVSSVHVIAGDGSHYWPGGERAAIEAGAPINILSDPERKVSAHFDFESSPMTMALDVDGVIRYVGNPNTEFEFWKMIVELRQSSMSDQH